MTDLERLREIFDRSNIWSIIDKDGNLCVPFDITGIPKEQMPSTLYSFEDGRLIRVGLMLSTLEFHTGV